MQDTILHNESATITIGGAEYTAKEASDHLTQLAGRCAGNPNRVVPVQYTDYLNSSFVKECVAYLVNKSLTQQPPSPTDTLAAFVLLSVGSQFPNTERV